MRWRGKGFHLAVVLLLTVGALWACGTELDPRSVLAPLSSTPSSLPAESPLTASPPATPTPSVATTPVPALSPTATETGLMPATATPAAAYGCPLGTGLRQETVPLFLTYRDQPGMVMSASPALAEAHYPELEGWIRLIGAPSLAELEQKADRALDSEIPYEGLAYGLETGRTTPAEEWQNLIPSTEQARTIADTYGKLLVMGPGPRLMASNEDKYAGMVPPSHIWMFQTQEFQRLPPGPAYREEVARIVDLIRASDPGVSIWAQITLPPDRDPSAEEWLAYRDTVADLVDGTYIGVYTWGRVDTDTLVATLDEIFAAICGDPDPLMASE